MCFSFDFYFICRPICRKIGFKLKPLSAHTLGLDIKFNEIKIYNQLECLGECVCVGCLLFYFLVGTHRCLHNRSNCKQNISLYQTFKLLAYANIASFILRVFRIKLIFFYSRKSKYEMCYGFVQSRYAYVRKYCDKP